MPTSHDELFLHDLLNLLTVVNGQCQMLQLETCKEANTRLQAIREASNRMIWMIEKQRGATEATSAKKSA